MSAQIERLCARAAKESAKENPNIPHSSRALYILVRRVIGEVANAAYDGLQLAIQRPQIESSKRSHSHKIVGFDRSGAGLNSTIFFLTYFAAHSETSFGVCKIISRIY